MRRAKRIFLPALLGLVLAGAMATTACRCDDLADGCKDPLIKCNDGQCHQCCIDDECFDQPGMRDCAQDYVICNDDYYCECVCYEDGEDCSRDPPACCDGLACDIFTNTCISDCSNDADCLVRTEIPFYEELTCKNGVCDFNHCSRDADCVGDNVCFAGNCVTPPECADLDSCRILPATTVTRTGTNVELVASAYVQSGSLAPGITFTWSTNNPGAVTVDSGVVTGGADTGRAIITATTEGCDINCTTAVRNLAPVEAGQTRVLAVDLLNGTPIPGATVQLGIQNPVATDENGEAGFGVQLSVINPADITVSHHDYQYVTYRQVTTSDVVVHLEKVEDPLKAGGVRNRIDFSMVRCQPPLWTCDIRLGFGGTSIPPTLNRLKIDTLLGQTIPTEIEFGGSTNTLFLPASFVFCLNQTCFKEHAFPQGVGGNRVVWAYGGKIDLSDLLHGLGLSWGPYESKNAFLAIVNMFRGAYSAVRPNVDVVPIPKVADRKDINDNGRTDDLIPDYLNFTRVDTTLDVQADENLQIAPPRLPLETYDVVLVVAGILVPGAGLVPLGVGVGEDSLDEDDIPNGVIDGDIEVECSEVVGRIPEEHVQRVVLALAFNKGNLDGQEPLQLGGQIIMVDRFEGLIQLDSFMVPAEATYDPVAWHLQVQSLPGNVYALQAIFSGVHDAAWHIYSRPFTGSFYLPDAPPEGDRSDKAALMTIRLKPDLGYQDIPAFNHTNLDNIIQAVEAFSYTEALGP